MKRLLAAVLASLRKTGQRPSQAGSEPRLSWRGIPLVERRPGNPADSPFDTLTVTKLDRAGHHGR
jgi:hypothetical protein